MKDDGYIYCFRQGDKQFHRLDTEKFIFDNILQIVVDESDVLWIFTSDGNNKSYQLKKRVKTSHFLSKIISSIRKN